MRIVRRADTVEAEPERLPKCNIIYVLDDGLKDDHKPDFNDARKRSNRNINQKTKIRDNVKKRLIEIIDDNISIDKTFDTVVEIANAKGINDQQINRIFHEETIKIRGNM